MVTFKFDLDGDAPEEIATYMVRLGDAAACRLLMHQVASANFILACACSLSFLVAVEQGINQNITVFLFILMWPCR